MFLNGAFINAGEAGFTPTSIDTTADVSLDKVDAGFAITKIALKSEVAVRVLMPLLLTALSRKQKQDARFSGTES